MPKHKKHKNFGWNLHNSFSKWWLLNLFSLLVPSTVKNIHISPNGATDSLTVNWTPGGGDVDSYIVSAFRQSQKVDSQTVSKDVSKHTFHRLEAGEQYQIVISSVSGSLRNQIDALGRTGKCPPGKGPVVLQNGTMNGLSYHKSKISNSNQLNLYNSMWFQEPFSYFLFAFFFLSRNFQNKWKVIRNQMIWINIQLAKGFKILTSRLQQICIYQNFTPSSKFFIRKNIYTYAICFTCDS